jgi:hypothetical protein
MKRPALWLALLLFLLTAALLFYRIAWLGYPVFPTAPGRTWELTINARVMSETGEARILLGLPTENPGRMVVEERISSGSLSMSLTWEGPNRIGIWSGPVDLEGQEISYRATILVRPRRVPPERPPGIGPYPDRFTREEIDLAERLAGRWKGLPPSNLIRTIAATAKGEWKNPPPEMKDLDAWKVLGRKHGREESLLLLLRAANLPARLVEGLSLGESIQNQLLTWVESWNGKNWETILPERGEVVSNPAGYLPLSVGGVPALRVSTGGRADIRWSLSRQVVSEWSLHFERIRRSNRFLDQWSLFHLPAEFQRTFRLLLLVPIGALIIGFLRNMIGFPTFGVFMPVLMALAFRSTGLAYGLSIFAGMLLLGYIVRRRLDKLRLLLVPRMSVILTLVIVCFTFLALAGNKLGMREFMAVGLLPFVILTMVIERFFVLVEEAGTRAGLRTAAGSAAVSIIAYGIISWEPLQLTFFVYPELLATVAAVQVLLGRYTGYRLSELFRFRAVGGSS